VFCDFESELSEIVAARRFAEQALTATHPRIEDALVIVSELASNAVRHARSGFRLEVDLTGDRVRIEVADHGAGWPTPSDGAPMPTNGGMGLHLVEALADRWGAVERPDGKLVWAELDEGEPGAPAV
jgi:anti-sigma regulatory factor (Ser/Thr protein kinase)